jgi:dihydroorotate dehydrogenase (fumarate)
MKMSTDFLGMSLKNPLVPSSSPLAREINTLRRMEDLGAAAVVLHSLFEEEITLESQMLDRHFLEGTESFAEALTYFPEVGPYRAGPEHYLEHLRRATEALSIPVIGSLNGVSAGGWVRYAGEIERAGAAALELNMYFVPTDPNHSAEVLETMYIELVEAVASELTIPLCVKLSPFYSALPNFARRLTQAGARGLTLFNRFYQPDLDIEALEVVPHLVLSDSDDLRLPLRWIAILHGWIEADLALTSGVHTAEDAIKGLMAGASVIMMTSELLQRGVDRLGEILQELEHWLTEHEYESVKQLRGSMSQANCASPAAFERANYMKVLGSYAPPSD